jgi:uncharacterized protein (DUF1501 family)
MTDIDQSCGCREYESLSRRQFVSGAGAVAASALFPAWLPRVVLAEHYQSERDVIVSIFLRGGVDGLTLCVPFADANYYTGRPTQAVPPPDSGLPGAATALDNFFGLPPAMTPLLPAYLAQDLLIVHACGQSNHTSRSHFDAQRWMEIGKAADPTLVSGWLGRHLATAPPMKTNPEAPLRALGLASGLQKTLVGGPKTLPISNPASFTIGGTSSTAAQRQSIIQADYAAEPDPYLNASAVDATNTVTLLQSLNINGYVPANGAVYANNNFARSLRSVAALIKADVGIEAAQVDLGGWDTHANQGSVTGSMANSMTTLAMALRAFYQDVIATSGIRITLVAMSEFGRNARQNGSEGTDHGRATAMLVMGKGIAGGRVLVNGWPGLAREQLERGDDLRVTTDFRDVLAEIVQRRLGNTDARVFPGYTPTFRGVTR